jgi:hypothetical protein
MKLHGEQYDKKEHKSMSTGRKVSPKERAEIRREYRSVLKSMNRAELLSTWYGFFIKDEEKMKQAEVAAANLTNEQLIKMILDRDVQETVEYLETQ